MRLRSPPTARNGPFFELPSAVLGFCDADGMGTVRVTWEETRGTVGPFIFLSGSPASPALDTGFACTRRGRGGDKNVLQIEKTEKICLLYFTLWKQSVAVK